MTKAELIVENGRLKAALETILYRTTDAHFKEIFANGFVINYNHVYLYAIGEIKAGASIALGKEL